MRRIIILGTILLASQVSGQIYEWKDKTGTIHFSDQPHPGAQKIKLKKIQTIETKKSVSRANAESSDKEMEADDTGNSEKSALQHEYQQVMITQPLQNATIRNNQGVVTASLLIVPELQEGDKIQILLDGAPIGQLQTSPLVTLNNIPRGMHTLTARVLGNIGQTLITSQAVTFYVHRSQVKKP